MKKMEIKAEDMANALRAYAKKYNDSRAEIIANAIDYGMMPNANISVEIKGQSESCEIVRAMQDNKISPLEGWRALKGAYAAMSPADRVEDYICAARDLFKAEQSSYENISTGID